ncbi:MAG TPA: thioredoxin [Candidatus Melainabacteria bacterium]|nr:thioredoxin [Candidatus Melainabacteria bacterium]HIN66751.1 thioredoxin [Candidatus Obscuribacterales bacterium]
MFEATKRKFSDVSFQVVDVDKDKETSNKYGVSGIPHLVFLDGGNNVLYSGGAFGDEESFAQAISRFH